jgi:hypothetical protein
MPDNLDQPELGPRGGPRTKGVRNPKLVLRGVRRAYVVARLQRDGYRGLADAIRAGRVSAHTVAIQLGWTKRPVRLGSGSGNAEKRRRLQLQSLIREGLFDAPPSRG